MNMPSVAIADEPAPEPDAAFAYLVQAETPACGVGPLGTDSAGQARVNTNPSACLVP